MIPAGEIVLYWYSHDGVSADTSSDLHLLDDVELARHRAFECPKMADLFAFRHSLLRRLLAHHCSIPAAQLKFDAGPNGKPSLSDGCENVHFNTSHTKNFGVVAVCENGPIGIDVERVRPLDLAAFSEKILSSAERLEFAALSQQLRLPAMLRYWTAKEALIKAEGMGLNLNLLRQISIRGSANDYGWSAAELTGPMMRKTPWHLWTQTLTDPSPRPAIVAIASRNQRPVSIRSALEFLKGQPPELPN